MLKERMKNATALTRRLRPRLSKFFMAVQAGFWLLFVPLVMSIGPRSEGTVKNPARPQMRIMGTWKC
jgi:hypothetical protein